MMKVAWQDFREIMMEYCRYRQRLRDEWKEADHPRNPDGTFGEGGGGTKENGAGQKTSTEERQRKIASVKIDFGKDNILPGLNKEDLAELGKADKPVLLKKNIIDKNKAAHTDIKESDYAHIIGQPLYSPDLIAPGHSEKPYFNFVARVGEDKNTVVLLELSETKANYEIVNVHWLDDRTRRQKEALGEKLKTTQAG
jgi:hypothetical protein